MEPMTARLAGRKHHVGEISPRSVFVLVHERANPVDFWAVAVYADGTMVGYLETGLARLVAPMLDRGRPVFASAIEGKQTMINVYVPGRRDRLGPDGNLIEVESSDGARRYVVDRRHGHCTCPAGRFVYCRHQAAIGARDARKLAAGRARAAAQRAVRSTGTLVSRAEL
jgi:hypothetical protein